MQVCLCLPAHPLVKKWLAASKKAKELNGALVFDKSLVLSSHVSRAEVDRCALLYDSLIKASESVGYKWSTGDNGSFVRVDGEELQITIQERIKRFDIPPPPPKPFKPGKRWEPDFTAMRAARFGWEPTGIFFLIVDARSEVLIQKLGLTARQESLSRSSVRFSQVSFVVPLL